MHIKPLFAAVLLTLPLAACTASSTQPGDLVEETQQSQSAVSKKKYHYEPSVENVYFAPGCGVVRIDQPPCPVGWKMTFTKSYLDLEADIETRVNESTKEVTITLDTWSYSQIHSLAMVRPETVDLTDLDGQTSVGGTYHVTVVDRHHETLFEGDVTPRYAY
jgi:hypothetical protein